MALELRVVEDDGTYGEILPDWSDLTFSQDLLSPGTLTFTYPIDGRNSHYLRHTQTLAVRLDGVEPANCRFIYDEGTGSRIAESDGASATYGCTSVLAQGDKMLLGPAVGSNFADEALFAWTNKTPGDMVITALENTMSRAVARGVVPSWLNFPVSSFSRSTDSSGTPWAATFDASFTSGTDNLSTVLEWLTNNGFAEPLMKGRDFNLLLPEKNGRDLSILANPVVLQTGRDFVEASYQTSSKDLVTSLLVMGDDNSCVWVQDYTAIDQYGYLEGVLQVSNASSISTLTAAGRAYLSTRKMPRYSYTYSVSALYLDENEDNTPRPFIDYQVGDFVLVLDGFSTAVQRIRLMSATWPDSQSSAVNLTVNDLFAEKDAEFDRRLSRLGT